MKPKGVFLHKQLQDFVNTHEDIFCGGLHDSLSRGERFSVDIIGADNVIDLITKLKNINIKFIWDISAPFQRPGGNDDTFFINIFPLSIEDKILIKLVLRENIFSLKNI